MSVSVMVRIQHKFGPRILEWYLAIQLCLWGLIILLPQETFAEARYVGFGFLPEPVWGTGVLMLGVIRVGALIVNGSVPNVTPWIRVFGAYLGALVFTVITLAHASSGLVGLWIAAWPIAAVGEWVNTYRAARDARASNG